VRSFDLVVIGAGSVGLPLSYYCAKRGMRVAVVDREPSWGRGQNRAAIGGVRATHSDPAKIRICKDSIEILSSFEAEHGIGTEWRRGGYLFIAYDEERVKAFRELLVVQRAAGLDIDWIGPDRVIELAPGINAEGLRGGTFSPGDGYASPLIVATAFHKLAMDAGVEFAFGEEAEGFRIEGGRIVSMRTGREEYAASCFVNAAGADAAGVAAMAGSDLAVRPDCHEGGVTEPVARFMEPMLVDIRSDGESGNYYFYQTGTGQVVFCITPRPQVWGKDIDNTSGFLPLCVRRVLELYPRLRALKVRRTWRGAYPMTPDGLPLVGFDRGAENLLHAAGMCGQGFMIGPGLGRILAAVLDGEAEEYRPLFEELSPYRKFEAMEMLK
jgi:sarcosine oxidase subunit beta